MEDMAIPQPTRLDQLGKMYSSYFRPDDVRVLAITTNCNKERQKENKETRIKYNCWFLYYFFSRMCFFSISSSLYFLSKYKTFLPTGIFDHWDQFNVQ